MKKKLLSFTLALIMALSVSFTATANEALSITIDGKPVSTDVSPFIDANGRTMVPVRFISEALAATVDWNPDTRTVTVTKGPTVIKLVIDSRTITVGGTAATMDTSAIIRDGRTFVPVRYIAEALGLKVGWSQATRTVVLTADNWIDVNGRVKIPPSWTYDVDDNEEGMITIVITGKGAGGSIKMIVGYIIAGSFETALEESLSTKAFVFDNGIEGLMLEFPNSIAWVYKDSWWDGILLYHEGNRSVYTDNESIITAVAATLKPENGQ